MHDKSIIYVQAGQKNEIFFFLILTIIDETVLSNVLCDLQFLFLFLLNTFIILTYEVIIIFLTWSEVFCIYRITVFR